METISEYYHIKPTEYKLYHMIFLLAGKLKTSNTKETNNFWINEIEKEINNIK